MAYHLGNIDPKMEKVIDEAFDAVFEDEEKSKKEQK